MCGLLGIVGKQPISELIFNGMLQLQHRGQDAAGVFLWDTLTRSHRLHRQSGLVTCLFDEELFAFPAQWGIGHTRYATSGSCDLCDAQPLSLENTFSLVHNGNLVNYPTLREELEKEGVSFLTKCDSEALLHLIHRMLPRSGTFFEKICAAGLEIFERVDGSYSVIGLMADEGLFAFRDPRGIRPLLLGKGDEIAAFASETLALKNIGCTEIEDILPGEVVTIDAKGTIQRKQIREMKHAHCSFEFNYFAKTHSQIEGREVYSVRAKLGKALAQKIVDEADVVVPIPETGFPAGIALAKALNLPLEEGFVRQGHSGRTFIMPGEKRRRGVVVHKLAPIPSVFQGKRVILVDDSIIRGTVSQRTIALARQAGAVKIIFASTFPPVRFPCVYGIDFPYQDQLIASQRKLSEIAEAIGADTVVYNDVASFKEAIGLDDLCMACLTGEYPTSLKDMQRLQALRRAQLTAIT